MNDEKAESPRNVAASARHRWVAVGFAFVWSVIGARLVFLHAVRGPDFARQVARQQSFEETLPPRPGEIIDRHGRVLATSVPVQSLWVNPKRVSETRQTVNSLAAILDIDAEQLRQRIARNRDRQFLWVKRRLTEQQAAQVRRLKLPPDAWGFRQEYRRHYPQGSLAAHLLGFRDVDGEGQGGVEQAFNAELQGTPGRRAMRRDARGRIVEVFDGSTIPPQHGRTVTLTLDVVLQHDAERELDALMARWKPKSAGVIVMDPRNAEVLATASRPAFDPNSPVGVPADAWKNVNTASMFEPGSTFKPFVVAWALQRGVLKPGETFHCENGTYRMGRRVLHDHHSYGRLSV
ncbi:MAG: peptidoglycan D,D-transpeptidase FtsI family protein, partial [Planctomycetaceae bacterium]